MVTNLFEHEIFGRNAPQDPETLAYHYTTLESAIAIAGSGTLRLNRMEAMNDPREYKHAEFIWRQSGAGSFSQAGRDVNEMLARMRLDSCAASFTRDSRVGSDGSMARADGRGYARPTMWSHYGGRHSGVCFIFERNELFGKAQEVFGSAYVQAQAVTYSPPETANFGSWTIDLDRVDELGARAIAEEHFAHHITDLLFVKNQDWSGEKEWRLVLPRRRSSGYETLQIEPGTVRGAVVGIDFSEADLGKFQSVCQELSIATTNVARVYHHQLNVLDVLPINTGTHSWKFFTQAQLRDLGYL